LRKLKFADVSSGRRNPDWNQHISRDDLLYERPGDLRSEFERDYTRIVHSKAYRRLKHKTQVFFATHHDHVCTRSEHVTHVASISNVIAKNLGLNQELTNAIASGHDIGHAPFGHHGETVLGDICRDNRLSDEFWHERNSLFFADNIETLINPKGHQKNLDLTYAVRDGIVCHCGEVNETAIVPRQEPIDLYRITKAGQVPPYTWEACIVKIVDKIAYLGRDIEDAFLYQILDRSKLQELRQILVDSLGRREDALRIEISNTVLINSWALDLCKNSSPDTGITLSSGYLELMERLRQFSSENIYNHWRIRKFKDYATLVMRTIFQTLDDLRLSWCESDARNAGEGFPLLSKYFQNWLVKYSNFNEQEKRERRMLNRIVYDIHNKQSYQYAIIGFISSMTDHFAVRAFNEIISF
jgi:dGTPase